LSKRNNAQKETMKVLICRDVGFDCDGVVKAETEEEVLRQAAAHAKEVHDTEVTPEMAEQIKPLIREE
jgi:predicted small metal-binding protein